nr:MAG TPA: hypothetical protein [Caudoviricetes sp.]
MCETAKIHSPLLSIGREHSVLIWYWRSLLSCIV